MVKEGRISLRVSAEVREALKEATVRESRSLNNLIEKILTDWLRARGYLDG